AIVVAAGIGRRMGRREPKALIPIGDRPLLYYCVKAFHLAPRVDSLVLTSPAGFQQRFQEFVDREGFTKVRGIVTGAETRQGSVFAALEECPEETTHVLIHDGARPYLTVSKIEEVISELAAGEEGVALANPARYTLRKREPGDYAGEVVDRDDLMVIQTPQGFAYGKILEAHEQAHLSGVEYPDDTSVATQAGMNVKLITGHDLNFKVTYAFDTEIAEALLPVWKRLLKSEKPVAP
ncbi:MAG TPA: 2-C-methyl-D-erythritol 4-phosphate cytidylyltransferase, partial [bacterium]|nr:2-C-methyl-D-erythritol 4-phosphate cytidylyltransferase [bacterium]